MKQQPTKGAFDFLGLKIEILIFLDKRLIRGEDPRVAKT